MAQYYSDPKRADDPHALPDLEVFYAKAGTLNVGDDEDVDNEAGYFYWFCFPGCLPDSDPVGPFATEAEALADAREGVES